MEYFVIKENPNGGTPSAAYCQGIRDQYGLTMPVLLDPDNLLGQALGYYFPFNDRNVLIGPDMTITMKQYGKLMWIEDAIEDALGL